MPALGTGRIAPRVEPGNKYSQGGPLYGQKLGGIAERQELSEAAGEAASATAAAAAVGPGPLNSLINRTNRAREGFRRQTVLQSQVDAEKEKLALAREQEVRQWAQMALEGKFKGMEMQRQQQALDAQISQNKQENAFKKEDLGLRREGQAFDQAVRIDQNALDFRKAGQEDARIALQRRGTEADIYYKGQEMGLRAEEVKNRKAYYDQKANERTPEALANRKAKIDASFARYGIRKEEVLDADGRLTPNGEILQGIIFDLEDRGVPPDQIGKQAREILKQYSSTGQSQTATQENAPSEFEGNTIPPGKDVDPFDPYGFGTGFGPSSRA